MVVLSVRVKCVALLSILTWLLVTTSLSQAGQSDIDCLKSVLNTFEDPERSLASWNFSNTTAGFICRFTGVQCWQDDEDRVLNLHLGHMGLRGEFPQGLAGCSMITGLDLSGNNLRGNIPSNISHIIGFVTTLDLSSNQFTGEIPVNIANCSFLNSLQLSVNQLSGQIPLQIGQLGRLNSFSVARNRLSGPVPSFNSTLDIGPDSFAGNAGLCGRPLPVCGTFSNRGRTPAFIGAAVGGVCVGALGLALGMYFYMRCMSREKLEEEEEDHVGNTWAKNIKGAKHIKISMFGKSVPKMSLADLMKATNDFCDDNIIGSGRTGTMYKAVLHRNRTSLIVKRLQDTQHSEKQFLLEMATLEN